MPQTNTRRKERMTYEQAFSINGGNKPPQALELEEAVLGALLLDENALNNVVDILHEEYFYQPQHQVIYRAIHKLFEQNQKVDILTVADQLRKSGELEAAGGAFHLSEITSHIVSGAHIEYYARVLSEKYISRELIRVSTETISHAYDETTDVVDLLDKTEQHLMDINDKNFRTDYHPLGDLVYAATKQIEEAAASEEGLSGLPTGYVDLDRITTGFHPGTLIILAARPAMGKTAFALSMARNMAVDFKKPIAFFSLEMTGVELAMRLIASEAQITSNKLKKGDLAPYEKIQLETRTQTLNDAKIFIDDTSQLTIYELRAKCRRLKQHYDIQMVFIDYLQLMSSGTEQNRNGNREQEISTISRQLKALSKELGIPVLAMSQLSRAVETRGGDKKPMLSDLRESGAIEQDADMVMFIHRPEYYKVTEYEDGTSTAGMADIIIAKHRSGSVGDVRLRFIPQFTRFENREFVTNEQLAAATGGMMQNTAFDSAGPGNTFTVPSSINDDFNGGSPFGGGGGPLGPDNEEPF